MNDNTNPANKTPAELEIIDDTVMDGTSILIVDDNLQNVELLEAYLESLPCSIITANDGVEAIDAVNQEKPDLIILDIMMPKMSGFEVCQKLKSNPKTRDIPIIMVTALNEVGDVERGVEAGTDEFLSKPFNKLELITRVRSLLKMRLLKKQLHKMTGNSKQISDHRSKMDDQTSPSG